MDMCLKRNDGIALNIFGEQYTVPDGLTVLQAMEYVGHLPIHKGSCGSGFCGRCAVVIKKSEVNKPMFVLACRTLAEDGMIIELPLKEQFAMRKYSMANWQTETNPILHAYP